MSESGVSPSELPMPRAKPHTFPLSDLLSCLLPTETQTWLLRACLWSGEPGRQAWEMWQQSVGEPILFFKQDMVGSKALLPLLSVALRDNHAATDTAFETRLRTAYLRDELRSHAYRHICQQVLSRLAEAGIEPIVLKGAALAESVYPDPVLQHSHNFDLLLQEADLLSATQVLVPLGFPSLVSPLPPEQQALKLVHESGLPVVLHRRLFRSPFYALDQSSLWARSHVQPIAEVPARVLSPADTLLQLCVDAVSAKQPDPLRWACDSWFVLKHSPQLDWNGFLASVQNSHLALPVAVTLGYLAEALDGPVPAHVFARLARPNLFDCEVAIGETRARVPGGILQLLQISKDWQTRARILKWLFLPSRHYLRVLYPSRPPWLLPIGYVSRPLKYMTARL